MVTTLGRLVGIGRSAEHDRLARPRSAGQLGFQDLDEVRLDAHVGAVALVTRAIGAALERTHVAERTAVRATHVRIERPAKRHSLDAVERRAAGLLSIRPAHLPASPEPSRIANP